MGLYSSFADAKQKISEMSEDLGSFWDDWLSGEVDQDDLDQDDYLFHKAEQHKDDVLDEIWTMHDSSEYKNLWMDWFDEESDSDRIYGDYDDDPYV